MEIQLTPTAKALILRNDVTIVSSSRNLEIEKTLILTKLSQMGIQVDPGSYWHVQGYEARIRFLVLRPA